MGAGHPGAATECALAFSRAARRWLRRTAQALLPSRCLLCGEAGDADLDLCAECFAALPWNRTPCAHCGLPLAVAAAACGQCLRAPPPFAATFAPWTYAFPLDRLLPRFKFHGDLAAGALVVRRWLAGAAAVARPQAFVPVPLHARRLRERGYDQALELARPLARGLDVELMAHGLARLRATSAQTALGAGARRRNVRGAFVADRRTRWPPHVALVDDVMTTGATLAECARVLRAAGVARVDVWVAARAAGPATR
jgi:ComF family protein